MSLKWPNKDPDELTDYSIDWSRFITPATINSVTWYVDDADGVKTELVEGRRIAYLAQHQLFEQLPGLLGDFDPPPVCDVAGGVQRVNAWIGLSP